MAETFQIKGFKELNEALKAFPITLQRKALKKAVREGSKIVQRRAKALAPKGDSGALRRNIRIRRGKRRRPNLAARDIIGVVHGKIPGRLLSGGRAAVRTRKGLRIRKLDARERRGEDPYYFRWVELGYKAVGRRRRGPGRRIPGQRFLTRAFDTTNARVLARMRTTLRREIATLRLGKGRR